ncbi:MAG: fructose-bisphosphate aldolase [Porticoccaceae bacterium]|nr:MAG: fructose-bisphosphate aldolase [Porticoccaceae bacterium]
MNVEAQLEATIRDLVDGRRGILAADESTGTIGKRFAAVGLESTPETRRQWRALLLGAPGLAEAVAGVILFEETLEQCDDAGVPLPEVARRAGLVPGIKVDKGTAPLPGAPGDRVTHGLDGLEERLRAACARGARFAKWREVYPIGPHNPTPLGIEANAEVLARYAAVCQSLGVVPIVEPEVLIDGDHEIDRAAAVCEAVWHAVFHALHRHGVLLEYTILKPSMVTPGRERRRAPPEEVAEATLRVLKRTVPAAVPAVNFLSGGQTPEEATANLDAINRRRGNAPWQLGFSFARALQQPALEIWAGRPERVAAAQAALVRRARLAQLAMAGSYEPAMEAA